MSSFTDVSVVVVGAGVAGVASAVALANVGARVRVIADRVTDPDGRLAAAGIPVEPDTGKLPAGTELVATSPGLRPTHPLFAAADAAGIEVISEVELAWRLRPAGAGAWLALTGTNGKTTAVGMLESMLRAAGLRAVATGNVGFPIAAAVTAEPAYEALAVELSSAQLHFTRSMRPAAAAILNVAPDHLDWHGTMQAYAADKARIFHPDAVNVINADDPCCRELAAGLPNVVGFTLGERAPGQLGVVDGWLVGADGARLALVEEVRPAGRHNVANALAAAALAGGYGISAEAIRAGLRAFVPAGHRNEFIAVVDDVSYVDDSKATNPHAAEASLTAYDPVVWIAGGLLKGADIDELVATVAPRLRAAVLLGTDRQQIAHAITRHAPDLPVLQVANDDDEPMVHAVSEARRQARPGDTVLLAPAAASFDMFANYNVRGDAFAAAVRALRPG
ncbi:MAG TPA: UDP-N-acetylmuramoyl-L-alanine--D-glutamate ligase [Mycobacteriales bacterium]|nr:UDP-N-acetylmuramoyl-L-alanine--D-glutamate ligase [Mycobacteriales bacterium]